MESPHAHVLRVRGFTLVEMLVVLAIIVIVTTIAINGQSSFNKSLLLTDTAYTMAFSIREAQSLGLSSRLFGTVQNAGYGIYVSRTTPTSYIFYADTNPVSPGTSLGGICPGHTVTSGPDAKPGNCLFDVVGEQVRSYTLNRGFTISRFCGYDPSIAAERCSTTNLDSMSIEYLRPDTQSIITGVRNGTPIELTSATLYLASPDGTTERCVSVSKVGQVAVNTCP